MNLVMINVIINVMSSRGVIEIIDLLKANPDAVDTLSANEKLSLIGSVILLGLGATFLILILLGFAVSLFKVIFYKEKEPKKQVILDEIKEEDKTEDDAELIAVITAAISASTNISLHNIRVKNIKKVDTNKSVWASMGRMEQLDNGL